MAAPLKLLTMREALESPQYLGTPHLLGGTSWFAWRLVLIAAVGERLTEEERELFARLTGGRIAEPGVMVERLVAVVGRRGGKSRGIAALVAFLAVAFDYRGLLAPGQIATVPVIAASKEQAVEIFRYLTGIFTTAPGFMPFLDGVPTANTIRLATQVEIQIRAASFRRARGFTAVACAVDEAAYLSQEESANPDSELIAALEPALATTGGMLIIISSPYGKRGEVWNHYNRYFGADGDPRILVIQADSKTMNPNLSDAYIARAYEKDPIAAASELGAQFRSDVDGYISDEVVRPLILNGVFEISPKDGVPYFGFVDAASGSGQDAMTMGIAHRDGDLVILDCVVEKRPPFSPEMVTMEFAVILRRYRVSKVVGDKWASGFVEAEFRRNNIMYEASADPKSDLYAELTPLLNAGKVRLLDNKRMIVQLLALERRKARGGRDSIDHPPRGHDDLINAACGALLGSRASSSFAHLITPEMIAEVRASGTGERARAMAQRQQDNRLYGHKFPRVP